MVFVCSVRISIILLTIFILSFDRSDSVIKRCFSCRSRGELGSCKDKFRYQNVSLLDNESGVEVIPCASGWCGKVIETSEHDLKTDEYGTATQRMCLQRGPNDNEERCDDTVRAYKKVFMCFCRGDLCNSTTRFKSPVALLLVGYSIVIFSIRLL